jgi:signal transduction histidine kinase
MMDGGSTTGADAPGMDAFSLVAHELRASLTVLNGYLSMLGDDIPDTTRQRYVRIMGGVVAEMHETAGVLVLASRVSTGTLPNSPRVFDVMDAVSTAAQRIEPRAELERASVGVRPPAVKALVCADRSQTARIITNLLNNALTYSRRPASVTIEVRPGDPVEVAVHDRGVGIPHDRQRAVFEPFLRLGAEGTAPGSTHGLGLGLYISRELAALNGGSLELEHSEPGRGSVFVLRLPRAKEQRIA